VWLKRYLESRKDSCKALFVTECHPIRRMTIPTIRYSLKILATRGKVVANVYPHRFRHTYACQLLDNGAPLEFIQGMLGHEKASTTQIYAQLRGERFMREGVGVPAPFVAIMPLMPTWPKLKEVAHTLKYDTLLTIDLQQGRKEALNRWKRVTVPTLVAVGGKSPDWMRHAMQELANVMPNSKHRTLEGQTHIIKASVLSPVLQRCQDA
jgi:hypothetical protein